MGDTAIEMKNIELLGRVLDGQATCKERKTILKSMSDIVLDECFIVALKAAILFNENVDDYD